MSGFYNNQPPNGSPPHARQPGQVAPMSAAGQHDAQTMGTGRQNASMAAPYPQNQPALQVPSAHTYQPTYYPQQAQPNPYAAGYDTDAASSAVGGQQVQQFHGWYPAQYQSYTDTPQGHQDAPEQAPMAVQGWRPQQQQPPVQNDYQANGYGYGSGATGQHTQRPSAASQQNFLQRYAAVNAATAGYGGMFDAAPTLPPTQPIFNNDGIPTPYAISTWVQSSATGADNRIARFPLRITGQNSFIAPLPFINEQERRLQQTTRDVDALGQLYVVDQAMSLCQSRLPFAEGQEVLTTRIELGRFGNPHWQTYPANDTFPARHNQDGGDALTQQPWLPPHAMPRHPAMAYWGRNLSLSSGHRELPTMRAYVAGQVEHRPLFVRATDGDRTDRGWGPGVTVHEDQQPYLQRATAQMQQLIMEREAVRWAEEGRGHSQE